MKEMGKEEKNNYRVSEMMIGRLVGILSTSVLSEDKKEELLFKIPFLYQEEAKELHEYLMNNQLCPITQTATYSFKGVNKRLDYVMENDRL